MQRRSWRGPWRIYSRCRLEALGFGGKWKCAYLELDGFDLFMASFSMFHFGARFPLFFGDDALRPVPQDWYNLRLHLYSGDKDVPAGQSNVRLRGHKQPVQNDTIALDDPIPWFDPEPETSTSKRKEKPELIRAFHPRWNGMKTLNQFRPCNLTSINRRGALHQLSPTCTGLWEPAVVSSYLHRHTPLPLIFYKTLRTV